MISHCDCLETANDSSILQNALPVLHFNRRGRGTALLPQKALVMSLYLWFTGNATRTGNPSICSDSFYSIMIRNCVPSWTPKKSHQTHTPTAGWVIHHATSEHLDLIAESDCVLFQFSSLFAASCDLKVILAMWDVYLQHTDPFLVFFLALVIIVNAK